MLLFIFNGIRVSIAMKSYIKLMRVRHYIKNLLVFAALACSGQLFDTSKLLAGLAGFGAFCMVSSAVYIINDIKDKESDSRHPVKSSRPIASGEVSVKRAALLASVLLVAAFLCNLCVYKTESSIFLLIYLILNLAYSFGLKNVPLADVAILASGFLIRVLYGSLIFGILVSDWLYLTVIAAAFYFALGKRRNELKKTENGETRHVLKAYPINFLDKSMYMCLTLTNVFYALWSMDDRTKALYGSRNLVFTAPIVLLITMKYCMDVEGDSDGDPVEVLMKDKALLALCAVYLAAMLAILYL